MTLRLAVLASGKGSNLVALERAIREGRCDASIALVASDKADAGALDFARERGVPTAVVPFEKSEGREAFSAKLADVVAEIEPDLVVLAGFMRVLSPVFIGRFSGKLVNIHPSLLPAFRGKDGVGDALAAGARITGCTVHLVDEGVDTGAILAQAAVPVLPGDTRESLHARIQIQEHALLPRVVDDLAKRRFQGAEARGEIHAGSAEDVLVSPRFSA